MRSRSNLTADERGLTLTNFTRKIAAYVEMSDFLKCECLHCGQHIEFPVEGRGQTIPCPTCGEPTTLVSSEPLASTQKMSRIPLSQLSEVTIRGRTKSGDTPLHRAAKTGKFDEIPKHLLQIELFLAKNSREETPLHFAAKHGHLNQIPSEFLTIETLTALDYYGRTPLHIAADYRHVNQIPTVFLTPAMLSLPTKNFTSNTILHFAAATNMLDLRKR